MRRKELTDYPFNKESFREVIIKARGDRSQAEFAQDCGLSYAYLNKYANGKLSDAPTIGTIKKISVATKTVSYEELLTAAGYDAEKYKDDRPVGASRKDFFHPVFIGMANSAYDWRIESKGYKDNEPFEVIIERNEVNKWFFVPVTKAAITKDEIQNILMNQPKFTPGSKVSFVTDDAGVFEALKAIELPLLSLYISVVRVIGVEILDEVSIKTSISTDMTIKNEDYIRPFEISER